MTFESAYRAGDPPWDIGQPQPAIVRLDGQGDIVGDVIDVGCGTGENALYLAARGHAVVGVDAAPTAIARARDKARLRDSGATFLVADAFELDGLGRTFDVAIDCGLFHTFSDSERARYAQSLHGVLRPAGHLVLLCFSERQPGEGGPRRVTRQEIEATFADGWTVDSIEADRFAARFPGGGAEAWLARLTRT
jgi:SAM-dependent methyltransferase